MNILILYARAQREMDSFVMMKLELEKRGHYVEAAHRHSGYRWLCDRFYNYDLIVVGAAYMDRDILEYRISEKFPLRRVVSLNWEQYWGKGVLTIPDGVAREVTLLCWGELRKEILTQNGVSDENVIISGPMQFDFCRPELRHFLKNKAELAAEYALPEQREWILFIGGFFTYTPKTIDTSEQNIQNVRDRKALIYKHYFAWMKRFAENHPDIVCLYRPHPIEVIQDEIFRLEEELDNFKIIPFGNLREWINASEHCNLTSSSTIADVYMLDKTCTLIHPEGCGEYSSIDTITSPKCAGTYDEFERENISRQGFPCDTTRIKKAYSMGVKPAYINVCDIIEEIHEKYELPDHAGRFSNDLSKYDAEYIGKLNALAFLTDLMADDCIFLCEVIANIFEVREIVCTMENNMLVYERDSYKEIRDKVKTYSKKLGIDYVQTKDIAMTHNIDLSVECFDREAYESILSELEDIQTDTSEKREERLLNTLENLFMYQYAKKVGRADTLKYMKPYSAEIARAVTCKMKREKYSAPAHLKGGYDDFVKPLNEHRNIIIYGAGKVGSVVASVFKDNGYDFEIWDIDYANKNFPGMSIKPPFCMEPNENLIVAIALGYQDQYSQVKQTMEKRGYKVIDALMASACLRAIREKCC